MAHNYRHIMEPDEAGQMEEVAAFTLYLDLSKKLTITKEA